MDNYNLSSLNNEQMIPVVDTEGAVLVTAGAGSGKTRMLTHRIAYLILKKNVSPYNILAITFTNKAASEMKERLFDMIEDSHGLWVSTFHSMCVSILRKFIDRIGYKSNFSIYSETEKERVIKKLLKERGVDDENGLSKRIAGCISSAKNEGMSPDTYGTINKFMQDIDVICAVFCSYENELKKSNSLDFDDLLFYTHKLLKDSEEAREHYQNRFKYIHVDEFQDTNTIQYKLLLQLAAKHRNVFVVGDEDQCIYGWRGANIQNIRSFINDFGAKVYKLEQNYRSTKQILNAANALISANSMRIDKNLWTENEDGLDITHYAAVRDSDEADYVLNAIASLRGKGFRFSDMAILMRLNALSRGFEQRLLQYNIPYKVFGGFKFFDRKEVKDILAYTRMIANPQDNEAILRVINFPKRGIGDIAVNQLLNYTAVSGRSLFETILNIETNPDLPHSLIGKIKPFSQVVGALWQRKNDLRPHEFLSLIVDTIELRKLYKEPTEENENRIMHIGELIESAAEYSEQNEGADICDYLQMITLYTDTDEMDQSRDYVSVATIHSAKGLEFPVVFIVGLEEGVLPLSRASSDTAELEEERRLMYVAITRAKKRLYITRSRSRFLYGAMKETIPSRFLEEIGIESTQPRAQSYFDRYKDESSYSSRYNSSQGASGASGAGREASSQTRFGISGYSKQAPKQVSSSQTAKYRVGMMVKHKRFGVGKILSIKNGSEADIEFSSGKLTLALNFAPLEIVE